MQKIWICRLHNKADFARVFRSEPAGLAPFDSQYLPNWQTAEDNTADVCLEWLESVLGCNLPPYPQLLEVEMSMVPGDIWEPE